MVIVIAGLVNYQGNDAGRQRSSQVVVTASEGQGSRTSCAQ